MLIKEWDFKPNAKAQVLAPTIGIYYELFEIYTLYIEEVDMNKKSNAGLICEIMNYRKKR